MTKTPQPLVSKTKLSPCPFCSGAGRVWAKGAPDPKNRWNTRVTSEVEK